MTDTVTGGKAAWEQKENGTYNQQMVVSATVQFGRRKPLSEYVE